MTEQAVIEGIEFPRETRAAAPPFSGASSIPIRWRRVAAVLVVLWAFQLPTALWRIVELNVGIELPPIYPWLFFGAPVVAVLGFAVLSDGLRLPYVGAFLTTEAVFCLREIWLLGVPGMTPDFRYAWGLALLYAAFLTLVNTGSDPSTHRFVRSATVRVSMVVLGLVLVAYLGVIDVGAASDLASDRARSVFDDRVQAGLFHANGLGFGFAVAVIFLVSRWITLGRSTASDWAKVLLLFSVVVLHASRGNTVLIGATLTLYLIYATRRLSLSDKFGLYAVLTFGFIAVAVAYAVEGTIFLDKLFVVKRMLEPGRLVARSGQAYAAWIKFLQAPVVGHGYLDAARGAVPGILRSNFHFAQVLAAYGLVGFIPFLWLLIRLFVHRMSDPRLLLHMLAALVALSLYNWAIVMPLAVVAYSGLAMVPHDHGERGLELAADPAGCPLPHAVSQRRARAQGLP